jgi:hypothetical protein
MNAIPGAAGNAAKNPRQAANPPAEAPTPTTQNPKAVGKESESDAGGSRGRCWAASGSRSGMLTLSLKTRFRKRKILCSTAGTKSIQVRKAVTFLKKSNQKTFGSWGRGHLECL